MCKIHLTTNLLGIALMCFALSTETKAETTITRYYVYFDSDKHELKDSALKTISDLAKSLPKTGTLSINVNGHTDADGSDNYNVSLSEKRTSVVMEALITNGVEPGLISRAHFGERKPTDQNSNETGKAKNRRVEITVRHAVITSLSDLIQSEASLTPETFNLKTNERKAITGKKGIQLTIPENAFVDSCGYPVNAKNVSVVLTEFMNVEDAFFHGVTSMSDKGLLESGGMFNVEAFAGNNPLKLKDGKTIDVKIPAEKLTDGMKVYTAAKDSTGSLIWIESPQAFQPVTVPEDTKKITLSAEKYAALVDEEIQVQYTAEKLDTLKPFNQKEPQKPHRPRYSETPLMTMKNAFEGVDLLFLSKQEKANRLDRINTAITAQNEKRLERYDYKMQKYLKDSLSFDERKNEFKREQREYALYLIKRADRLLEIKNSYQQHLIKNRIAFYIKKAVAKSKAGKLYNSDLLKKVFAYCISDSKSLRDNEFEKAYANEYRKCKEALERKYKVCYFGETFLPGRDIKRNNFYSVIGDSEIKNVLLQLVDDNPYLSSLVKEYQKSELINSRVASASISESYKNYYAATVGQLGYVNCDRLREAEVLVNLELYNANSKAQTVAFVKDLNASQQLHSGINKFKKGEQIKMLSVYFEEGKPFVATNEVKLNDSKTVELKYQEMKPEELKEMVLSFI